MRRVIGLGRTWANTFSASVKFVLCKDGHKTHNSSGRTIQLVRLRRRTKVDTSSRRIMRRVPVFILDQFNRRRKKFCPSSSQTNYASLV